MPTLRHFHSTQRVPQVLENLVTKSLSENRQLDHVLLHGLPGCGSALVAQALAREFAPHRCIEFDALEGCSVQYLKRAMERSRGGGILIIRHIEVLDSECDQLLGEALGHGEPCAGKRPSPGGASTPSEDPFGESISRSASSKRRSASDSPRRPCDFTLIGTAHIINRIGYRIRTRFDHMIHLRKDPRGLRAAVVAAVKRQGIDIEQSANEILERFLRTTDDCAEQLVHAIVARAEIEGVRAIDEGLTRSIVTEDLPARISDESYGYSLQRHLCGRRIIEATDAEVERLVQETGWGETAVRGAIFHVIQDDRTKRGNAA